jgi:hypothetical protein
MNSAIWCERRPDALLMVSPSRAQVSRSSESTLARSRSGLALRHERPDLFARSRPGWQDQRTVRCRGSPPPSLSPDGRCRLPSASQMAAPAVRSFSVARAGSGPGSMRLLLRLLVSTSSGPRPNGSAADAQRPTAGQIGAPDRTWGPTPASSGCGMPAGVGTGYVACV